MVRTKTIKGGRRPKKTKAKPMPGLVYQDIDQLPAKQPPTLEQKIENFRSSQNKAKSWMWLGVLSISAIIFFFWGWSLMNNISLFNWKRTQESTLIKKTQDDWNDIFTQTERTEREKKQLKEQLGIIINEIKKQTDSAATTTVTATTTSSTLDQTTTTTSTIR